MERRLLNGPRRAQSKRTHINPKTSSILRREGIRQLPGICWYPVRAQAVVKQGGTAGSVNDPSLTEADSVMGGFLYLFRAYGEIASMSKRKPQRGDFTNGGAEKV